MYKQKLPDDYDRRIRELKEWAKENGIDYEQVKPKPLGERMQEQGPPVLAAESPFDFPEGYNCTFIDENNPNWDLYQARDRGEISCKEFHRLMDERLEVELAKWEEEHKDDA